jgi:DNA polymerase III sliding clamp (beta) subunit (PCNA family)
VPDCKHAATFDRDAMLDALQKSSVVAGEKVIPYKLTIGNGVIVIITMSQGRDCGESEIEATTGPAAEIGVNAKYMIDAVNAFAPGSAIGMEYSDGNSAFIMSDGSLNVVTMPMRI